MLVKKLRINEGTCIVTIDAPKGYEAYLEHLPKGVQISCRLSKKHDFIHLFVVDKVALEKTINKVKQALNPAGLLWISFPKGSSGIQTDLTRDKGWECLETLNMERLTLISFNDQWSAFLFRNNPPKANSKTSEQYHKNQSEYVDVATKTIIVPEDLAGAFKKYPSAFAFYDTLSFTNRKEYVMWIAGARQVKTRLARIEKTIEKLQAGKKNPAEK